MKRCYLAGPMRGIPKFNFPAFFAGAASLRERGYEVWSPAENDVHQDGFDPAKDQAQPMRHYMKRDLPAVLDADFVAVLPGWEQSRGAMCEVTVARACGIPVLDAASLAPIPDATNQSPDSGSGIEVVKAALIEHYKAEGDDTACMVYHRCEDARQLSAAIIHDLDTAWNLTLSAWVDAETAIQRAEKAEGDLESATQPLDAQMARLNARVTELNKAELALRNIRAFAAVNRKEAWAPAVLRFCAEGGVDSNPLRADVPERGHSVCKDCGADVDPEFPDEPPPKCCKRCNEAQSGGPL